MRLDWSDEALADLDRFAEEHPRLGRPIAGREEYRQLYRFSARLMSSNIGSMASISSCCACFTRAKRGSEAAKPIQQAATIPNKKSRRRRRPFIVS